MATKYSPNYFLRQTPNALLEEYFQQKEIDPIVAIEEDGQNDTKSIKTIRISELTENHFQPIQELIDSQGFETKTQIENDFREIAERACKAGFLCLLDEARFQGHGVNILDDLSAMENHYERAMWVFLRHPKIFRNSGYFQKSDRTTFRAKAVWKNQKAKEIESELDDFKEKVIEHYKKEGRGGQCHVEILRRPDPERIYFFVYLSDYSNTLEEFDDKTFKRTPIKPAFEVVFAYHPKSGKIETNASGQKKDITHLQEVFCQTVLGMEKLPDKNSVMYNLEKLKSNFDFKPREDNIAAVHLKLIELEFGEKQRIAFTDNSKNPNIYSMMEEGLNQKNIPLDATTVGRARIQVVLRKIADERKPQTKTFDISTPDSCGLKDTPIEVIARRHIEKWGFVSEEAIEPVEDKSVVESMK